MTVLALEFSSDRRSVALARDGAVLAETVQHTESRATNAFALIENVLAETKTRREDIGVVAVGLGPGSYTGIRSAIALAQGWRLARGVKLIGVSSAAAMAVRAQTENIFGRVNVMIDAQRGEFYLATWDISATDCREISPLKIASASEIESGKAAGEIFLGLKSVPKIFPGATEVARLAGEKNFFTEEVLEPIYLRAVSFVKAPPSRDL